MSIPQAIEFAIEEGDEELWEVLISLSIHNPSEVYYNSFSHIGSVDNHSMH